MMTYEFSGSALRELRSISRHIARDNPYAAKRLVHAVYDTLALLGTFPEMGRSAENIGTKNVRVISVRRYAKHALFYRIDHDRNVITVMRMVDTRRDAPTLEKEWRDF